MVGKKILNFGIQGVVLENMRLFDKGSAKIININNIIIQFMLRLTQVPLGI